MARATEIEPLPEELASPADDYRSVVDRDQFKRGCRRLSLAYCAVIVLRHPRVAVAVSPVAHLR